MTVTSSETDADALTATFVAEFDAPVERVWQLWEDPRQLESWWGPPTWPATFEQHDFQVGGQSSYYMSGPDGEKSAGWWDITAIEPSRRLELDDGFADDDGNRVEELGSMHEVVTLESVGDKTRMTMVSHFRDAEQLEKMTEMGMEEGTREALGQIDTVLAETPR